MDHMERVMFGAIEALAQLAETQDACKTGRARRVGDYAAGIGTALGLPGHTVRGLRVMGQLIDVGMLQIPRELLWRPGALSAAEFELVKTHAERGHEVLRAIEFPWPVAEAVRQHHERLDGSGYPRGLKGEEILLEARIVAVADAVEAMLSPRPHRPALDARRRASRSFSRRLVAGTMRGWSRPASSCCGTGRRRPFRSIRKAKRPSGSESPEAIRAMHLQFYGAAGEVTGSCHILDRSAAARCCSTAG